MELTKNTLCLQPFAQFLYPWKLTFILSVFIVLNNLHAQSDNLTNQHRDSKIFQKRTIEIIQSKYLDNNGNVNYEVFQKKNGLYPLDKKYKSVPFFTISILKSDLIGFDKNFQLKKSAKLFNLDFFVENTFIYKVKNKGLPIWDGRVYEENNQLIVGGYSSNKNERPIGYIDDEGKFIIQLDDFKKEDFPLLQLPKDQLLFDPFHKELLQIHTNKGQETVEKNRTYLPLDLYSNNGELLTKMQFEIVYRKDVKQLILFGIIHGEKVEIARSEINNINLVERKEAFRPELIKGATQFGKGEMVTLTFKGTYSKNIQLNENELLIKLNNKHDKLKITSNYNTITLDGDFSDWRNIKGVDDVAGDHVSYLYNNPDTDILQFKVSNDDKYIYFYTRVAGAHGRTGAKGRYYWYTYIDVDRNRNTGYPPTRDDNCYFGIDIGDDSEAQFEFIDNKFVKTFFGFTGTGSEQEVLNGILKLGPSYYAPKDGNGKKRAFYKMEYVNRKESRFLTEDYTEGTSEDIIIALSPDSSEVEVRVEMAGFLRDTNGNSLIQKGLKIDIAVGVEGSSNHYNSKDWGADSSRVIYNYLIK